MLAIDIVLFGVMALPVFLVQMLWIPFWAAGVINGVGHYWGYRNFETQDASRNIVPFGVLIGGEEFHNNHHAYAYSAKLGNKWWEFDIGWVYIRMLELVRLASVKRIAPKTSFATDKSVDRHRDPSSGHRKSLSRAQALRPARHRARAAPSRERRARASRASSRAAFASSCSAMTKLRTRTHASGSRTRCITTTRCARFHDFKQQLKALSGTAVARPTAIG